LPSTQPGTSPNAASRWVGSVRRLRHVGRPPPLPPTRSATWLTSSPAGTLAVSSCHTGDEQHLAILHGGQHDRGMAELVLELVEGVAQVCCRRIERAAAPSRFDVLRWALRSPPCPLARRARVCSSSFSRPFTRAWQLLHLAATSSRLRAPVQPPAAAGPRSGARRRAHGAVYGLDTPHAGRDTAFGDDLEQANIASALHMRATHSSVENHPCRRPAPHRVFLAEQCHGTRAWPPEPA